MKIVITSDDSSLWAQANEVVNSVYAIDTVIPTVGRVYTMRDYDENLIRFRITSVEMNADDMDIEVEVVK